MIYPRLSLFITNIVIIIVIVSLYRDINNHDGNRLLTRELLHSNHSSGAVVRFGQKAPFEHFSERPLT